MSLIWGGSIRNILRWPLAKSDLRFYGITIGWFGIGILRKVATTEAPE